MRSKVLQFHDPRSIGNDSARIPNEKIKAEGAFCLAFLGSSKAITIPMVFWVKPCCNACERGDHGWTKINPISEKRSQYEEEAFYGWHIQTIPGQAVVKMLDGVAVEEDLDMDR